MRFIFDPDKDKLNLAKHGLSLSFAEKLIWDEAYVWVDPRFSYDELRMIGLVPEGNTLYYVAFVDRGGVRRIISLRLAERREVKNMSKTSSKRVILMPSVKDNARIVAAAKADPDAKPMTKAQLDALVPISVVRGRPKSENKKLLLSVRYSVEVVEYFRSTGDGWQARMDSVLRQYVSKHVPRNNAT